AICGVSGTAGDNSCNLFKSGQTPGQKTTFAQLQQGQKLYDTDRNNFAPNVGFAWTPAQQSGVLGDLMGREGDFAIRGGYTRSFSRPGLNDFIGVFGANPGITMDVTRSEGNGNLGAVPVLLRDTSRPGAPSFHDA